MPDHPPDTLEERGKKDKDKQPVVCVDFDETITAQPDLFQFLTRAISDAGAKIVIITGNTSPRDVLKRVLDDWKITYDDLIQYDDSDRTGLARAEVLKKIDAVFAFDDRIARAPILVKACPHLFVVVSPKDNQDTKKDAIADAKQAAKQALKGQRSITLTGGPHNGHTITAYGFGDTLEHDGHTYRMRGQDEAEWEERAE